MCDCDVKGKTRLENILKCCNSGHGINMCEWYYYGEGWKKHTRLGHRIIACGPRAFRRITTHKGGGLGLAKFNTN